jgi:hypothetical protein
MSSSCAKIDRELCTIQSLTESQLKEHWRHYLCTSEIPPVDPVEQPTLDNDQFVYEYPANLGDNGFFAGKMFEPVRLNIELPECITWVFDRFSGFNPIVVGGAIRDTIAGVKPKQVDFVVERLADSPEWMTIVRMLIPLGWGQCHNMWSLNFYCLAPKTFTFQGTKYYLHAKHPQSGRPAWPDSDMSVHQFAASGPDQVVGSRIALHDLDCKQMRIVRIGVPTIDRLDAEEIYRYFRYVETPFGHHDPANLTYRDKWNERLRRYGE